MNATREKVRPFCVAHSFSSWLPLTMIWAYNQIKFLSDITSVVLAITTQNLDMFPWKMICRVPGNYKWSMFRVLKELGLRSYPHIYDRAIQKYQPHILHSQFGDRGWYDIDLAKRYGIKHVVTFYGYDVNQLPAQQPVWKDRYQMLFERADLLLCEGPYMAQSLVDLGCPADKVKVHRLGVEVNKIEYTVRTKAPDGLVKILIAGTFREKKGIPYALEAIGHLYRKYPQLRVTIFGDTAGQERELLEKEKILNVIEKYRMNSIVTMRGFQPYQALLEAAYQHHIFFSPSVTASDGDTEGGAPIALIDMSASGMPVLSTKHCDIPQVILDGVTGLLAEERDVEGLASHLETLIEQPLLWEKFGKAGREYIKENFDAEKQAQRLSRLYRQLTD